jgi:hypothetical protein
MEASKASAGRVGPIRLPGRVGFIFGVVTLTAATAVAVISLTSADPPNWIRIGTFWVLLLGIPGSITLGLSARRDPWRRWGLVGVRASAGFQWSR